MAEPNYHPSSGSFFVHATAGSIAGLAEHTFMFPMDTLKTNLQCSACHNATDMGSIDCIKQIVKTRGFLGLWSGVSTQFAGCVFAHAGYFSLYEFGMRSLGGYKKEPTPIAAGISGMLATTIHDLVMTPLDTIKQRMQLGRFDSIRACLTHLLEQQGARSLFISYPTTLAMNVPYGFIVVSTNDYLFKRLSSISSHLVVNHIAAGMIAGALAAFFTTPLDMVKTRLQTSSVCLVKSHTFAMSSNASIRVIIPTLLGIIRDGGVRMLFKGSMARVLTHSPSVAVSWTVYEETKAQINQLL